MKNKGIDTLPSKKNSAAEMDDDDPPPEEDVDADAGAGDE
jgi:hypothetical protein